MEHDIALDGSAIGKRARLDRHLNLAALEDYLTRHTLASTVDAWVKTRCNGGPARGIRPGPARLLDIPDDDRIIEPMSQRFHGMDGRRRCRIR
jgi:hypothetical protein